MQVYVVSDGECWMGASQSHLGIPKFRSGKALLMEVEIRFAWRTV